MRLRGVLRTREGRVAYEEEEWSSEEEERRGALFGFEAPRPSRAARLPLRFCSVLVPRLLSLRLAGLGVAFRDERHHLPPLVSPVERRHPFLNLGCPVALARRLRGKRRNVSLAGWSVGGAARFTAGSLFDKLCVFQAGNSNEAKTAAAATTTTISEIG